MHQPPQGPYGPPYQQQPYYPPPPTIIVQQQSGGGCLKAFLVIVGIIVAGNVITCATCAVLADANRGMPERSVPEQPPR